MTIEATTKAIEKMQEELNAMTGVVPNPNFDPDKPEGEGNKRELVGEFSCEKIQALVDKHVKQVTDIIQAKVESMTELMATWAPILNVPSNPLKIIKWALKIAFGPASLAVETAIKQIRSMIKLISALIGLITAVANAIAKLVACLEAAIYDAINSVIQFLYDSAADLLSQAEAMVDQLMAQILEDSGIQDAMDTFDELSSDVTDGLTEFKALGTQAQQSKSSIKNFIGGKGRSVSGTTIRVPNGYPTPFGGW